MGYDWQLAKVPRLLYRVVDGELDLGPVDEGSVRHARHRLDRHAADDRDRSRDGYAAAVAIDRGRAIARVYIEVIRNTPLLVQILIFYFIIGRILGIPRLWAGILCLAFYEGAFAAEIIRGGIIAVHRGQGGGEPQPRSLDMGYVP